MKKRKMNSSSIKDLEVAVANLLFESLHFYSSGKSTVDLELVSKELCLLFSSSCVTLGNSPILSVSWLQTGKCYLIHQKTLNISVCWLPKEVKSHRCWDVCRNVAEFPFLSLGGSRKPCLHCCRLHHHRQAARRGRVAPQVDVRMLEAVSVSCETTHFV